MRIKKTKIYTYSELSNNAKEKARDWFRQDYPDYDWWDCTYRDIAERAKELGIDLRQKPVQLMNGKPRYDPEIYFSGFYCQGSGSSFAGTWYANKMNPDKLKEECPTETTLHNILAELESVAKEDQGLSARITAKYDNWISVEVANGEAIEEQISALQEDSTEYNLLVQTCQLREEDITKALRDFNRWIYKRLRSEYEYLNSDEQVEESIIANEYEFTEEGRIA